MGCCRRCRSTRSEEHTSELQSPCNLVCRLLLEKKKCLLRPAISAFRRTIEAECHSPEMQNCSFRDGFWRTQQVPASNSPELSFFFKDTATTEIYTLSLHDALPI